MMKVSEFVIPHHRKWFNHILDHDIKNHIAGTGRGTGKSICVQDGIACDMENQYALGNPVESVCIRQTQNTHASTRRHSHRQHLSPEFTSQPETLCPFSRSSPAPWRPPVHFSVSPS